MFENLIPKAYAQTSGVMGTVRTTAETAVEKGEEGAQGIFKYIATNIDNWIAGVIVVIISYIISKMVASAIKEAIIKKKGEEVQESVLVLVERITTITILVIGFTIALAINGLNFTAVIGALSLGIGFALKDIIGNFISGIIMLSQDRVRIGDFIQFGNILGTIVSIDVRATVLQAVDGTEVVIPNQNMLSQTLISYSTNPFRRIELIVGVDYGTDLPMVTSLIKGIIEKDHDIVPKPESLVLVDEFSDSSINIKVLFWIESGKNWMKIRSNLANRIKKSFNELGINIPFPIRTLKLDEDDRSFLKTMDSMKKGIVPEPKKAPSMEQVQDAAVHTGTAEQIPVDVFKKEREKPEIPMPPLERAAKELPVEEPKPVAVTVEEKSAPPTHL